MFLLKVLRASDGKEKRDGMGKCHGGRVGERGGHKGTVYERDVRGECERVGKRKERGEEKKKEPVCVREKGGGGIAYFMLG